MLKPISLSMILAVAALGLTAPAFAQSRSAVSSSELDAAVAEQATTRGEAVRAFLSTDGAQEVANRLGMSASELSAAVATLDEAALVRLADQAGLSDEVLAGGADTIVISVTTVIIILLLLILVTR